MSGTEQSAQLRMATLRLARRLRAQKTDDSVSDAQFIVLVTLTHGPQTLSSLAEGERVSAPSMNRTVNCLEEAGYVARAEDALDRRRTNISITASGTRMVEETRSKREAWLAERLDTLTTAEREVLAAASELMARIAAS